MHISSSQIPSQTQNAALLSESMEDVSMRLYRVIRSLRLQADLVGLDDTRTVTLNAETLSVCIDGFADEIDAARSSLIDLIGTSTLN